MWGSTRKEEEVTSPSGLEIKTLSHFKPLAMSPPDQKTSHGSIHSTLTVSTSSNTTAPILIAFARKDTQGKIHYEVFVHAIDPSKVLSASASNKQGNDTSVMETTPVAEGMCSSCEITHMKFSPCDEFLAVSTFSDCDGPLILYKVDHERTKRILDAGSSSSATSSSTTSSSSSPSSVRCWEIAHRYKINNNMWHLDFYTDSKGEPRLLTGGYNGALVICSYKNNDFEILKKIDTGTCIYGVTAVSASSSSSPSYVINLGSCDNNTCGIYQGEGDFKKVATVEKGNCHNHALVSRDGKWLVVGADSQKVQIFQIPVAHDLSSLGDEPKPFKELDKCRAKSMDFSRASDLLAVASWHSVLLLSATTNFQEGYKFENAREAVAFSGCQRFVVCSSDDERPCLFWNPGVEARFRARVIVFKMREFGKGKMGKDGFAVWSIMQLTALFLGGHI